MSDTPRTDAVPRNSPFHHYRVEDVLDLCRQLERECAQLKATTISYEKQLDECARVLALSTEWIKEAKPLLERGGKMEAILLGVTEQTMHDLLVKPHL